MKFKALTTPEEWEWIHERAHPIACSDTQGIVAYSDRGILAVAVFDSFTVDACNVHFAIGSPFVIRHGFLAEIARHLFVTCGRDRIFGLVPANNQKALKLDKHIGMKQVAVIPDALAKGVDYIVMRMDKSDCRWLPEEIRRAA